MKYILFTMKDILINLVHTIMVVMGQDLENDDDIGIENCIIWKQLNKDELWFKLEKKTLYSCSFILLSRLF